MSNVMIGAASLPSMVHAMPTAVAAAVLCVAVIGEIVVVPGMLLPGGTVTLITGALIGTGRPPAELAGPVIVAIVMADQLAFFAGAAVITWWRRRRPGRAEHEPITRQGRAAVWLLAAMPSLAGASRMPYREFAPRLLLMRVPWLAAVLSVGVLAANSLREIGHVAGVAGLIASVVVIGGLILARKRPGALRALVQSMRSRFRGNVRRGRVRPPSR